MAEKQLWPYQVNGINQLAAKAKAGKRKLLFQLATGGGKTVCFAGLVNRFLGKQQRKIVILVHREELLKQAYKTLYDWYEIVGIPVTAGMDYFPNSQVYIAMVETGFNRLKKNPNYFGDVGLLIVDECHLGNFKKLYEYFPSSYIIGFTATPISSSKKDPLKNHFEDIVTGITIPELIDIWRKDNTQGLVPNHTINLQSVRRADLQIKNGEFDEREMSAEYSKSKHVQNCVAAYQKFCPGKKTIVFNCTIEHSKKVAAAFEAFGIPTRHLDGNASDSERSKTIAWFRETPGAVLNNVGLFTTGFDEPTIECVIENFSTKSLPKWLQTTGRGSRPSPGKTEFLIIDMGGNALEHGDWSDPHDWENIFLNPPEPSEGGEAPVKACMNCNGIIHASLITCKYCGFENRKKAVYDYHPADFKKFTGRTPPDFNVADLVKAAELKGSKEYAVLRSMIWKITAHVRYKWRMRTIDEKVASELHKFYQEKVKEWCAIRMKGYNGWHQQMTKQWLNEAFFREFAYGTAINPAPISQLR